MFGAFLGGLLRYGLQFLAVQWGFWAAAGTFLANSLGCLVAGIGLACMESMTPQVRLWLLTGFLGALTTLSGLQMEVFNMIREGQWHYAAIHWVGGAFGGFGLLVAGYFLGQFIS